MVRVYGIEIREMSKTDIASVILVYLDYYNNCEDGFEQRSVSEIKEYIRDTQKSYDSFKLIPSFYLDE